MRLTDLSLGGCYVDTMMPLPEGAEVTLNVKLGETDVALTGRVVHMLPDRGFGFAIAFRGLNDPVRQQLADFLRQHEQQ